MEKHALIIFMFEEHCDFLAFRNVIGSFVQTFLLELEASEGMFQFDRKEKHLKLYDTIKRLAFIQRVQNIIDDDPRKSITTIGQRISVVGAEDQNCCAQGHLKSEILKRSHFMFAR